MEHQCLSPRSDGGRTPNIDRIAAEGALFTDYYAQQSCTAGRATFITGQHPSPTGLLTVGTAGSTLGLQAEDPTLADLLKNHGYATVQHRKNHLIVRNFFRLILATFKEFPQRQELPNFNLDAVLYQLRGGSPGGN